MRCAPFVLALLIALVGAAEDQTPIAPVVPAETAIPDKAQIAEADQLAKAGLEAMQASDNDTARTVEAALSFSRALHTYEAANEHEKAREMQANIFWCKKRMNIDDLERFVASKSKDPKIAADLARIDAVVERKIPLEQADTYLADADRYALEHPDQGFLIAVRYFEVAERFVGTPASLKAQRKSLDYQAKSAPAAATTGNDTLFTRPAKPPQGRQPVPAAPDQKTAKDAVRKLYKDDFAERRDVARRAFAWRMFEQAKSSKDDPKLRYALISEALQLAVATRDIAGILIFSDELANGFDGIDAVAEKKTHLTKIKTDAAAAAALKLLDDPRDPAANATAGKYFCLTAEKWDIGLPLLALGNDPALAKIAVMEAANPSGAAQQMELADAWFAQGGGGRTDQGIAAWRRSMDWYKKALPTLSGVSKERVEQAVESMFPVVIDPGFNWDKISDKQWDKLKSAPLSVNCGKDKFDTGVVVRDGERARVVPHPTDTWIFQAWWANGPQAVNYKGAERRSMYIGDRFPTGALVMWVKEGQQLAPGIITGPGRVMVGPADSKYASKGAIRVKVLVEQ